MQKLENYQKLHWDVFYKQNQNKFYKDRHYIRYEFTELAEALEAKRDSLLLDYGCGVGNAFYPLIEEFGIDNLKVNACDISKTAVKILQENKYFDDTRITAHPCDLVNDEIPFE